MEINPKLAQIATFMGWRRSYSFAKGEYRWYEPGEAGFNFLAPFNYLENTATLFNAMENQDFDFQECFIRKSKDAGLNSFSTVDEWADIFIAVINEQK